MVKGALSGCVGHQMGKKRPPTSRHFTGARAKRPQWPFPMANVPRTKDLKELPEGRNAVSLDVNSSGGRHRGQPRRSPQQPIGSPYYTSLGILCRYKAYR